MTGAQAEQKTSRSKTVYGHGVQGRNERIAQIEVGNTRTDLDLRGHGRQVLGERQRVSKRFRHQEIAQATLLCLFDIGGVLLQRTWSHIAHYQHTGRCHTESS